MLFKDKIYSNTLLATWLGWLFDGLDSSLYPLVANQALGELIGKNNPEFGWIAAKVLAVFLLGWALGGYLFGYLGDKIGRAKALSFSILTYAIFTGLSGLSRTWIDLSAYRFLSGLGIGGEWALGVSLLAESVSSEKRIMSSAILATGFPLGYCLAVIANFLISPFGWRMVFLFGILPAFLVFFIRRKIKEPEVWVSLKEKTKSPLEIFQKKYSYNLTVAFLLGITMSLGGWGCFTFWFPVWIQRTLGGNLFDMTIATLILMLAHTLGCYFAGSLFTYCKRKIVFVISYLITFFSSILMYSLFHTYSLVVLVFVAIFGFSFGFIPSGFAIYFPELFPTKIRSTAKGFCFSTCRILTAFGVLYSGHLVQHFEGNIGKAASLMSIIFLFGAIVSLFAKETDKEKLPG